MRRCPDCESPVDSKDSFCEVCGTDLYDRSESRPHHTRGEEKKQESSSSLLIFSGALLAVIIITAGLFFAMSGGPGGDGSPGADSNSIGTSNGNEATANPSKVAKTFSQHILDGKTNASKQLLHPNFHTVPSIESRTQFEKDGEIKELRLKNRSSRKATFEVIISAHGGTMQEDWRVVVKKHQGAWMIFRYESIKYNT